MLKNLLLPDLVENFIAPSVNPIRHLFDISTLIVFLAILLYFLTVVPHPLQVYMYVVSSQLILSAEVHVQQKHSVGIYLNSLRSFNSFLSFFFFFLGRFLSIMIVI
jgi:hypothetical protein